MSAELKPIFEPRSILIVGASELAGEERIYSELFHSLLQNVSSYEKGKVLIVDLSGKIEGSYKNVAKVKAGLDLGAVLLPEKLLTKTLPKLLTKQPKAIIIMTGGPMEELAKATKRKKAAIIGPESIGVINTKSGLIAVPGRWQIPAGSVAFISQDSCVAENILSLATTTGIGKLVSVNKNFGTDESDILSYLSGDKETRCICVYLRKPRDGRKFIGALAEAAAEKPVIVLSGSPSAAILEAAVKQAGGILVQDMREMLNGAAALARQPPLFGGRIAVITNVSGPAELFEKYLARKGMVLAKPSPVTLEKIKKQRLGAEISNFIDLGKMANYEDYKRVAELLLSEKEVDGIAMINSMKATSFSHEDLRKITEIAKKSKEKPIVDVAPCASFDAAFREIISESRLPIYPQLEDAAEAVVILRYWGKIVRKLRNLNPSG